eukprot:3952386-Lingulodinium_polyedra.AAC.1
MSGTPTWVCPPADQRRGKAARMRRPVCRLKKALYGHPDSGTMWARKCDERVKTVGFVALGPAWPSCYMHPKP